MLRGRDSIAAPPSIPGADASASLGGELTAFPAASRWDAPAVTPQTLGEDSSSRSGQDESERASEHRGWRRRPASGSVGGPAGMLRLPPGPRRREALAYPWRKGNPGSPCLPGLGAGCRKRWVMGRAALAGLAAACYLSMAGRERVQNLRPSQPAHGSARHLPRALLIHSPGGRAGLRDPMYPPRPPSPGCQGQQGGLSG